MLRGNMNVRTVWVKDLEKKTNADNTENKSILFNVATDRKYPVEQKQPDGSVKKVLQSDFYLCRAYGKTAQAIADYCSAKHPDGKLICRRLHLIGHMETYKKTQTFSPTANVTLNGGVYPVTITHEETLDGMIFIVEEFEFLDSNPTKEENKTSVPTATIGAPIQGATAEQTVQPGTPLQVTATNNANAMNPPVDANTATQAPVANGNGDVQCPF